MNHCCMTWNQFFWAIGGGAIVGVIICYITEKYILKFRIG